MLKFVLRKGSKGQEVRRLQGRLGVDVTGIFDTNTDETLRIYQHMEQMTVDGAAGPFTLGRLGIPVLPGIDVSAYQKQPNWAKVYDAGYRWVSIKATEGVGKAQRGFAERVGGARSEGLPVSLYAFGRPDTHRGHSDAANEARSFIATAKTVEFDLQPVIDVEKGQRRDWEYNAAWVLDYCAEVDETLKTECMVYTARWAVNAYLKHATDTQLELLTSKRLWLADYDGNPEDEVAPWKEWTIWQTSGHGKVPGVIGDCDTNFLAGGMLDEIRYKESRWC